RDVPGIHAAALAADAAGFFGRTAKRRAVLAKVADLLTGDAASAPEKAVPLKTLSTLTAALAAAHAEAQGLRDAALTLPVPLVDARWNPFVPADAEDLATGLAWLGWLGDALNRPAVPAVDGDSPTHTADLRAYYSSTPLGAGQEPLTALAAAWQTLDTAADVQPADRARWAGDLGFIARWWATRAARTVESSQPVVLERWLALVRHLEPLRRHGLTDARAALLAGSIPAEDAALAFDKGLALASITEREDATALGDFNLVAHSKTITRFTASTHAVRGELPRAIPAEVLGLRRFDTNLASGQVGGLRRQLDRQRGGMSVRALLENYGDLITQVMPCTLMSPESVARFFPAHAALFDIVVFDEASQIRVADAIGAMGRAASVVVVGDSKQMPPTSFAEASANIDDEGDAGLDGGDGVLGAVADEESILTECVQARVPSKWLSWHYRSQDESLIAFSNHYYYESRLSSFPAPMGPGSAGSARASSADSGTADSGTTDSRTADSVGSTGSAAVAGHGVSLVRVNGQFERSGRGTALRTNPVEAHAIVDDIERRFQASPGVSPSVGVITFNAQQRNLIENLLRDSDDERIALALDEVDGLFVKNLENVQG
ncbi:AAA domain-containing protein, partial [Cryobacterium sp. RTC2.1]|uniref:DEAD/DEAH box helicase n=1 Tax=Cryobacterium sp. RTC2.1 TaxID=3048634 RepID=UPI002B2399A2